MTDSDRTHRRDFLGKAAALAAGALTMPALLEATPRDTLVQDSNDAWLERITGKHRQLFDMPGDGGGLPMVHIVNYLDTYNKAYGAKDADISAIGTFYGMTTLHGVNDAMWAKYRLGEIVNAKDGSGAAYTRNPWRTEVPVPAFGASLPNASIEALQKRGVLFLLCNNALTFFAGQTAKARGLEAPAVYADMKANILPDVVLVPAMVIAIEKAQTVKQVAYNRQ